MNERYAGQGYKIEVINLGVNMADSAYSLVDLALLGVEYEPDLVISYDGVNDTLFIGNNGISPDYQSITSKYDEREQTIQSRLPQWAFRSYLVSWVSFKLDRSVQPPDLWSQVYGKKISVLRTSTNPLEGIQYFERNLRLMRTISAEYQAKFMAATAHWVHPDGRVIAINNELRRFFQAEHIDFLDIDQKLPHDDWSIHVDPVHWSLVGEETMAEQWDTKIAATNALGFTILPQSGVKR